MIIARTATLRKVKKPEVLIDLNNQDWWHYQCRKAKVRVFGCIRDIGNVMFIEEFAVRFRVFVVGGEVVGISNKDPERPLTGRFPITVVRCDTLTRMLGKKARITDYACDWMVMKNGHVMFDQGFGADAGPCCFEPGKIAGIAMEKRF